MFTSPCRRIFELVFTGLLSFTGIHPLIHCKYGSGLFQTKTAHTRAPCYKYEAVPS